MRILFSGYHNPHYPTITEYIEAAIRSLGHDLFIYDDRRHIFPGRIRRRVAWLDRIDREHINRVMLSLAEQVKPEFVLVSGGERILPETVRRLKRMGSVTALWTTDPPRHFPILLKPAAEYDYIFCQGTEAIELFEREGIRNARWMPMACDPLQHHPVGLFESDRRGYTHDVVFVGSYWEERARTFESLTGLDLAIWGPGWEALPSRSPLRRHYRGAHTTPPEWLKIYSSSKIVLATHYHDPRNRFPVHQASPRVFEVMACGAFLICDRQKDVLDLFTEGEHLLTFENPADLADKVRYYLDHPKEREAIARQGQEQVLKSHTYLHRLESLLNQVHPL